MRYKRRLQEYSIGQEGGIYMYFNLDWPGPKEDMLYLRAKQDTLLNM